MVFKFLSNKFTTGRNEVSDIEDQYKKRLSFTKFIQQADSRIDNDPKYDILADFTYYDISCDRCLRQSSKVVNMYIMKTEELMLRLARGELIEADSSSILVTCPKCGNIEKITDLRQHTGLSLPEHLLPELQSQAGNIVSKHSKRDIPITYNLPEESKHKYEALLLQAKNDPFTNKSKTKELENYIKDYNSKRSTYKDKAFVKDIDSLDTAGLSVVKVEDIEY